MKEDRENARIGRPRQVYSGHPRRTFIPMKDRS
jgi:citrate synthase